MQCSFQQLTVQVKDLDCIHKWLRANVSCTCWMSESSSSSSSFIHPCKLSDPTHDAVAGCGSSLQAAPEQDPT